MTILTKSVDVYCMPYIKKQDRPKFRGQARLLGNEATCGGDLNYIFTEIAHAYVTKVGMRYANLETVVSALECAKLEFYSQIVRPYENQKIADNGDVGMFDDA